MRTFSNLEKSIIKKIICLSKRGQTKISPELFIENQLSSNSQLYVILRKSTTTISEESIWNFCKIKITGKAEDVYKDIHELPKRLLLISELIDYLLKEGYLIIQGSRLPTSFYLNRIAHIAEDDEGIAELDLKTTLSIRLFLHKCSYYYAPTDSLIKLTESDFNTISRHNNLWKHKLLITSIGKYLFRWKIYYRLMKTRSNPQSIKLNPPLEIAYSNARSNEIQFKTDPIYLSLLED
ncbi:MAG: hypothetical protein NVV82_00805 [Sporocytophaga sp.]|nr:hypothetical protein [Sporocytophaga sp.]